VKNIIELTALGPKIDSTAIVDVISRHKKNVSYSKKLNVNIVLNLE